MEPLVTAVITTYHRDKDILKRSIDSVINQTYKNIELIVVDDNGVDSNYHIIVDNLINKYHIKDKNITLIKHKKNKGVQRARNNGVKNARGEFIAFLDDDDEWLPNKIEKQMQLFIEKDNKDIALVYGWYILVLQRDDKQAQTQTKKPPRYSDETSFIELLRINYIGSTSVPLLRKESVIEVGGFDESLPASQDYDLWLRLTRKFQIRCINEPLAKYYIHSGERITANPTKKESASRQILKKYISYIKKDSIAYGNKMRILGKHLLRQKKYGEGRSYLKRSIEIYPNYKHKIFSVLLYMKSYWLEFKNNFN